MIEEIVQDRFRYEDGKVFYTMSGKEAGCFHKCNGGKVYRRIKVNGRSYYTHRVVWLLHHGAWPDKDLDHVNGDPLDNRIENLRECTHFENTRNASGWVGRKYKGVFSVRDKFRAILCFERKNIHLGYFNTEEEAALAYNKAAIEYHKDFAILNLVGEHDSGN